MIPLRITLKNFITYREAQTLDFNGASLWLLSGQNGEGKSTVFDGITFALYNCHRAGNKENAKDLINHHEDAAEVIFDFSVDGKSYRVKRTVARRGHPTRQAFHLIPREGNNSYCEDPIPDTEREKGFERWIDSVIGLNYDTFISSVLLLQGQSTRLLDVPPLKRLQVLKELVNLSAYEQLHARVEEQRKTIDSQVEALSYRLKAIAPVSEEDLSVAQATSTQAQTAWGASQADVLQLTRLLEQSKQWEQQQEKLLGLQEELQKLHTLLERKDEIEQAGDRLQSLKQALPSLKSLVENREIDTSYQQDIENLEQHAQQLSAKLTDITQIQQAEDETIKELDHKINDLQAKINTIADRLAELAPMIAQLSQLEELQNELKQFDLTLSQFSPDLELSAQQAEARDHELAELDTALPWLEELAEQRSALSLACEEGLKTREVLDDLTETLKELRDNRCEQLRLQQKDAQNLERELSNQLSIAQHSHKEARTKLERFEKASEQPLCELCGQEITLEHVQKEQVRLAEQISVAKSTLNSLSFQHRNAECALAKVTSELTHLEAEINRLERDHSQKENDCNRLRKKVKESIRKTQKAFNNLPQIYQIQVTPVHHSNSDGWHNTTYPTSEDLVLLRHKISHREEVALTLKNLRDRLREWQDLMAKQQVTYNRLTRIQSTLSLEAAQQARREHDEIKEQREEFERLLQQQKDKQKQIQETASMNRERLNKLFDDTQQCKIDLKKKQAAQAEVSRLLQTFLNSLTDKWKAQSKTIDLHQLEELKTECYELVKYEALQAEIKSAQQSIESLKQQISGLKTEIEQTPQAAQCSANKVEQQLEEAVAEQAKLDRKRQDAVTQLDDVRKQLQQRSEVEQEKRIAERQYKLYELLAKLLGPKYLQLYLLRQAEHAIVELANETLDHLSRGRLRLELRSSNEAEDQSDKALDLVVYDLVTGSLATAIAVTSSSQRFRIAVSLALAIGPYAGQETRRIESVIIDEGFGGLDKNGRDDIIHEFDELKQQLARIILVSHQDEIANGFANGYAIELINGASQVRLLNVGRIP